MDRQIIQLTNGARLEFSPAKFASRVATFLNNNRPLVDTDAKWDTAVDGMNDAAVLTACRTLLKSMIRVVPPGEIP